MNLQKLKPEDFRVESINRSIAAGAIGDGVELAVVVTITHIPTGIVAGSDYTDIRSLNIHLAWKQMLELLEEHEALQSQLENEIAAWFGVTDAAGVARINPTLERAVHGFKDIMQRMGYVKVKKS